MKHIRSVKMADGTAKNMTYEELCKDLGFIADIQFVELTNAGTISWTCGKPDEIFSLRSAAISKGYKISRRLADFS